MKITISKDYYLLLLNGRKGKDDLPSVRACNTRENVVAFLNEAWGILGGVEDVIVE